MKQPFEIAFSSLNSLDQFDKDLENSTNVITAVLGAVVLAAFISVIFISAYFSRSITRPISKLRDAAENISKGEQDVKIEVESLDEIGDLASSFNRMEQELRQHRDHLEETVVERTQELQREITERKLAEELLRESETGLKQAQRIAQVGSWEWNLKDDSFLMSEEMLQIHGLKDDNCLTNIETVIAETIHPDDKEMVNWKSGDIIAGKSRDHMVYRIMQPTREVRWVCASVPDIKNTDDQGIPQVIIGTIQDITDDKLQEEKLQNLLMDLQRSNKELEQSAYVASHDLQEPLRMISSYTQLLARRYKGVLDNEADDYIHYAVDGAKRMQAMISALLEYSRIGTRSKRYKAVNSAAILEDALLNLEISIGDNNAVITHDTLPTVVADSTQMEQLLQNLVGNAIKFHGEEIPRVHIAASHGPDGWIFSVSDNGIGIESQYSKRIFDIFQRLHTKAEYDGTGIGLSVCRKIVERHGGHIWMESELGKGSTFYFTIQDDKGVDYSFGVEGSENEKHLAH